ncbi:MAG: lysylphosphatidylglycerol synthase transmembrane domain-containing protein [Oscillochloridaceae bacterium umkhey_bin13]
MLPTGWEERLRSWKFWVGLAISAIFLAVAMRGLDLGLFWQIVRTANYWWLLPAVAVYFVGVWLRTMRWRAMLIHLAVLPVRRLFPTVVIGYMGNNVYPARAGEVLRSYVLRRNEAIPMSASLATVVLERLFDGLILLLFIVVTLPLAPLPPGFQVFVLSFGTVFLVALLVFMLLAARPARLSQVYSWVVEHVVPARLRPPLRGLFDRFVVGLQALRSPRELMTSFGLSVLIWLIETLTYWCVMRAFDLNLGFAVLMLMAAVVNLFTTIPSTPGYVGTFHAPGIAVLMQFGVPQALATGFTVVLHIALWLPITLLGAFYMLRQSIGWQDLERAAALKAQRASETDSDELAPQVLP